MAPSPGPSQPHRGLHRASSGATLGSSIVVFRAGQARVTGKESCSQARPPRERLRPLPPWLCPAMERVSPQGSTGCEPRTSPLHLLAMAATQAWLRGGAALTLVLASSRLLLSFSTHRGSAGDALGRSTGRVSLWAGHQSPRLGGQGRLPAWPDLNWDQCAGPGCNLTTPPWPRDPHPGHSASQAPDRSQVARAWCQQGTVAPRSKPGSPASASDCRSGQRGAAQCPPAPC